MTAVKAGEEGKEALASVIVIGLLLEAGARGAGAVPIGFLSAAIVIVVTAAIALMKDGK